MNNFIPTNYYGSNYFCEFIENFATYNRNCCASFYGCVAKSKNKNILLVQDNLKSHLSTRNIFSNIASFSTAFSWRYSSEKKNGKTTFFSQSIFGCDFMTALFQSTLYTTCTVQRWNRAFPGVERRAGGGPGGREVALPVSTGTTLREQPHRHPAGCTRQVSQKSRSPGVIIYQPFFRTGFKLPGYEFGSDKG